MGCSGDNCACECTGAKCGVGCTGTNCGPDAKCPLHIKNITTTSTTTTTTTPLPTTTTTTTLLTTTLALALDDRGKEGTSSVWLGSGHRFWLRANNKKAHNGAYTLSNEVEGQNTVRHDPNGKGRTACMWKIEYDDDEEMKSGVKVFIISLGAASERYLHSNQAHMNKARSYGWSWGDKSAGW